MQPSTTDRLFTPRQNEVVPGLLLLTVYGLTRIILTLKGGAFIDRPLIFAKQYLDPLLLETDLLNSLLHLHSQPPMFNLLLGAVLKCSALPALCFEIVFRTMGALVPLMLYGTLRLAGIWRTAAFGLTLLFMMNPTLLLYENLLYYTYCEAFLILACLFCFALWVSQDRLPALMLFWLSMLCLGMTRSLFHPIFFAAAAAAVAAGLRRVFPDRRRAGTFLLASLIALGPMTGLCLKNYALYGFFGTSSWAGMSLWIKTNGYDPDQLEQFFERGLISPIALRAGFDPFLPIRSLLNDDQIKHLACSHPADCNEMRSTGRPNYNHIGYVAVSRQLGRDALALIKEDPGRFAFYTAGSYSLSLWHASDSVRGLFRNNLEILAPLEKAYRFLYFGFTGVQNRHSSRGVWFRTALISSLFLIFYCSTGISLARKPMQVPPAAAVLCLLCLLFHAYTLLVSSVIEFGENNRFRFPADAAFLVLMAANVGWWASALKRRFK